MIDSQQRFAHAVSAFGQALEGSDVADLNRGGFQLLEVDLSDAALANGKAFQEANGDGIRFLRHGSNPGARLELSFSGAGADKFWAPGKAMRGHFDGLEVKRAVGSAQVGSAWLAIAKSPMAELREDLIISAIGPINLLGTTTKTGDPSTYVACAIDTDPVGVNPAGSFDGTGWELLRVLLDLGVGGAANCTTLDLIPWLCTSFSGTAWHESTADRISIPDTRATGGRFRSFTLPWSGRGLGALVPTNLVGTAVNVGMIVQGLR